MKIECPSCHTVWYGGSDSGKNWRCHSCKAELRVEIPRNGEIGAEYRLPWRYLGRSVIPPTTNSNIDDKWRTEWVDRLGEIADTRSNAATLFESVFANPRLALLEYGVRPARSGEYLVTFTSTPQPLTGYFRW